jgi:hypothetical protein
MKKNVLISILVVGLTAWQCSRMDSKSDLKLSFQNNVEKINTGIAKISNSPAYQLITLSGDPTKSDLSYSDSITLAIVAGIYDYQPDTIPHYRYFYFPYKLFKKTGDSEHMIINLPQKLVYHPRYMHYYNPKDTVPPNNFTIDASDYHIYINWWQSYDYKLTADLKLDNEDLGNMDIGSSASSYKDHNYSSTYNFPENYSITTSWETGDTSKSSFAFKDGNGTLLEESSVIVRTGFRYREKQYTLSIGNIDIVRTTGIDSMQVFLDGVLQSQAAVKIYDTSDTTATICHKRDILLTFDDGTTAKLSELISPALDKLRTLIDSLHSMRFAKNIVDYIAGSIYYNGDHYHGN